jgi:hypothetical protein
MKNWYRKLTKEQENKYVTICEFTWGGSPLDVDWAIGTNIYKEMEVKLLLSDVIKSLPIIEPLILKDKAK